MSKFVRVIQVVLAVALVCALGYGLIYVIGQLDELPPAVGVAVVAGTIALITFVAERRVARSTAAEDRRRERLAPAYEKLIEAFWDLLNDKQPDLRAVFSEFSRTLLLWAPADVINAVNKWRRSVDADTDPILAMLVFEELIRAIRKDLGQDHSFDDLPKGQLLRVFVNDIDEKLPPGP